MLTIKNVYGISFIKTTGIETINGISITEKNIIFLWFLEILQESLRLYESPIAIAGNTRDNLGINSTPNIIGTIKNKTATCENMINKKGKKSSK